MKKDLDLKTFKEKTYMFVEQESFFKAQNEMIRFVDDLINTMKKQKLEILDQMLEAKNWYDKHLHPTQQEIENFFTDTQD